MAEQKQDECKVLILGGVGFIGRNLVKYIVDNKLATKIRVADKYVFSGGLKVSFRRVSLHSAVTVHVHSTQIRRLPAITRQSPR